MKAKVTFICNGKTINKGHDIPQAMQEFALKRGYTCEQENSEQKSPSKKKPKRQMAAVDTNTDGETTSQ